MTEHQRIYTFLNDHVPENAVHYCFDLWDRYRFEFKLTGDRKSKLGDYRFAPPHQETITVNRTLEPHLFLITYIHEVSHLRAYHEFGRKIRPHGKEWKGTFSQLLSPLCSDLIFPEHLLPVIRDYAKSPTATSAGHDALSRSLMKHSDEGKILLNQLPQGATFKLNQRIFVLGALRRTRYLCQESKTGKKYLVHKNTPVAPLG